MWLHVRQFQIYSPGNQETGTELARVCASALLAMDVLIHPSVLPLSDYSPAILSSHEEEANYKTQENICFDGLNSSKSLKIDTQGMELSTPDFNRLHMMWKRLQLEMLVMIKMTVKRHITLQMIMEKKRKKNSIEGLPTTETSTRSEQSTVAAITYARFIEKDDVFANAGMNNSLMSSKPYKNAEFGRDQGSNVLAENGDFSDIIIADPDSDYEE